MRTTHQFSITLPNEMANLVKTKVAGGEYATESEVIREGLRALMHCIKIYPYNVMRYSVVFTPEALDQLESLYQYIAVACHQLQKASRYCIRRGRRSSLYHRRVLRWTRL